MTALVAHVVAPSEAWSRLSLALSRQIALFVEMSRDPNSYDRDQVAERMEGIMADQMDAWARLANHPTALTAIDAALSQLRPAAVEVRG